jgi:hypothetical protein
MAVSVTVPNFMSRYGCEFDQLVFEHFPTVPAREYFRKIIRQYDSGFITGAAFARRIAELVHEVCCFHFCVLVPVTEIEHNLETVFHFFSPLRWHSLSFAVR